MELATQVQHEGRRVAAHTEWMYNPEDENVTGGAAVVAEECGVFIEISRGDFWIVSVRAVRPDYSRRVLSARVEFRDYLDASGFAEDAIPIVQAWCRKSDERLERFQAALVGVEPSIKAKREGRGGGSSFIVASEKVDVRNYHVRIHMVAKLLGFETITSAHFRPEIMVQGNCGDMFIQKRAQLRTMIKEWRGQERGVVA